MLTFHKYLNLTDTKSRKPILQKFLFRTREIIKLQQNIF